MRRETNRRNRKAAPQTHPPKCGLTVAMNDLRGLTGRLMTLCGRDIPNGAGKLADNLIQVIHLVGEHECAHIGDSTGEVTGIVVLPASDILGFNDDNIVVDNGGSDVEEQETAVQLLENREPGNAVRSIETAWEFGEGVGRLDVPTAVIQMHQIVLGERANRKIGQEEFKNGVRDAKLGDAEREGIVGIRGNKLANDVRGKIVETWKMLLGAIPGEGEGDDLVKGIAGTREKIP